MGLTGNIGGEWGRIAHFRIPTSQTFNTVPPSFKRIICCLDESTVVQITLPLKTELDLPSGSFSIDGFLGNFTCNAGYAKPLGPLLALLT